MIRERGPSYEGEEENEYLQTDKGFLTKVYDNVKGFFSTGSNISQSYDERIDQSGQSMRNQGYSLENSRSNFTMEQEMDIRGRENHQGRQALA